MAVPRALDERNAHALGRGSLGPCSGARLGRECEGGIEPDPRRYERIQLRGPPERRTHNRDLCRGGRDRDPPRGFPPISRPAPPENAGKPAFLQPIVQGVHSKRSTSLSLSETLLHGRRRESPRPRGARGLRVRPPLVGGPPNQAPSSGGLARRRRTMKTTPAATAA